MFFLVGGPTRCTGALHRESPAASIRFRPVNQKQLVVQLPKLQQVVQVTIRPPDMMVCVVQDAQTAVAAVASVKATISFFMMFPY
jgi:hypothetical protein